MVSLVVLLLALLAPHVGAAQEPGSAGAPSAEPLEWKASWHRANWIDGAVIVGGFGLYLADLALIPARDSAVWRGPSLFDEAVRDLLRIRVKGDRGTAATISDVMLTGSLIHNWLFDNLVVALALRGKPDVAWQMSVANAQAYAISFSVTGLVKTAAGRERPYQGECGDDPEYSDDCDQATSYRAFFSGHAGATATGAGLLCAHHTHMPLYDGRILDLGACALGIGMTLLTGAMRISSDKHWATDVLTGHLVGFSSGYLVPTLLYYRDEEEPADTVLLPRISPDGLGVVLMGRM